jgi:hypothetical protein
MQSYNLIEVGRDKYSGRVRVIDERSLLKEVKKHLRSSIVDIHWNGDIGTVVVGPFDREVGLVTRDGGVS